MKKTILAAVSATALLALGACADDSATDETVEPNDEVAVDLPSTPVTQAPVEMNNPVENGDSVSITSDGVQASVNDGDTRVNADVSGEPSLEVETD